MSIKRPIEPFSPAGGQRGFRECGGRWLVMDVHHEETRDEMIACINLAPKLAERVVERMRELGWQVGIRDAMSCYMVHFSHRDEVGFWAIQAEIVPEGLCLAALRSLGHTIDKGE